MSHPRRTFYLDPDALPDYKPLEAYAAIGDSRTAVLIGADGAVDWACLPDFDSPAVFGALLDPEAGHFAIRPTQRFRARQYYERGTNVLVTEFTTADGLVRLRDFMPYVALRRTPSAGIYRRIEGVTGDVELRMEFAPRFDFGQAATQMERQEYGARATGPSGQRITISAEMPVDIEPGERGGCACAVFSVEAGEEVVFVADWGARQCHPVASYQIGRRLQQARAFWRGWTDRLSYHGRYREAVERSLLALKLLIYEPTGAVVAAPTTSLPEWIGGSRNWDYRYSWVRDSAFILRALMEAGYREEGTAYFDWMLGQVIEGAGDLKVMYGIHGETDLLEKTIPLRGYRDSQPVRVGNGAHDQFQLDIYGSLLDAADRYDRSGGLLSMPEWEKLEALANIVLERWREPDAGIWEARNEPQHYTYSKVWAWVALTRAARLGRSRHDDKQAERWTRAAAEIKAEVYERAWNSDIGAFTQAYDGEALDSAVLVMPSTGFIRADDERMIATTEAVVKGLAAGPYPLLYRYHSADGVGGPEGAFLLPSFWLVENFVLRGDYRRARATLDKLVSLQSPVGLMAEEMHPEDTRHLGNFPQGFSHLGLVNAVLRLEREVQKAAGWV
jgi:GH15 family glucan-1,4-alpha-glucosidase